MDSCFCATQVHERLERMTRLALGTVQFGLRYGIANQGGQVSRSEAKSMLRFALANDIDTLDTAIAYGSSEVCLGEAGTQGFKLVTKLPKVPNDCEDVKRWIQEQVIASLSRLGVTSVYGLLLHQSDQLLGSNGTLVYQALQELKDNGQVQKVGVSIYSPAELDLLIPKYRFDLVQAPFNLVDRRLYSTGWMQRLKDDDIEIHTRSVFLQGLLLMSQADIPYMFSPWNELWEKWYRWLSENEVSAVQSCLAFSLSFPEIDRVVIGADSQRQLAQVVNEANKSLDVYIPDLHSNDQNLINPAKWNPE